MSNKKRIALIAAHDRNRVIGHKGVMPWHFPEDLKHFKELTTHHTLIMGRVTYEAIGRPLPDRKTIVLSQNPAFHPEGCQKAESLSEALRMAGDDLIFIAGGMQLYQQTIETADLLYLTEIDAAFQGDAFFPEFDPASYHQTILKITAKPYPAVFKLYRKKQSQ